MAEIISKEEGDRIVAAIKTAELNTSGEIRVHIQRSIIGDVYVEAKAKFEELGLTATKDRNGVLFFVAFDDKKFAVLGDRGINNKVPKNFWNGTVETMREFFVKGEFAAGIEAGILKAGDALKEYFPYQTDDVNELSDEISITE